MDKVYRKLVWLGAGKATDPKIQWELFEQCILFEADLKTCNHLKKNLKKPNVKVKNTLVSATGGRSKFRKYNLSNFSALSQADELSVLFPGLTIKNVEDRESVGVVPLIESLSLTGRKNWLIVDMMDSCLDILIQLKENQTLSKFERLIISYSNQTLYKGMPTLSEIYNHLDESGFDTVRIEDNDPDFPIIEFEKDPQAELISDLKMQKELLTSEYKSISLKVESLEADIKRREILIHKLLEDQSSSLQRSFDKLTKTIKFHSSSTAKQVESSFAIQRYLETGEKSLSFHGWPISADLGAYLVDLIDNNEYDAIIEFGSGTSTVLMAKVIKAKQKFTDADKDGRNKKPKILSFDHNEKYFDKTTLSLEKDDLSDLVNLVHAPLIDYSYDDRQFSFYDCESELQKLATKLKDRCASLLVLIDGPPEATNDHARFPALPHLLRNLKGHSFTILLDDYDRKQEKEAVKEWIQITKEAALSSQLEDIRSEKGLAVIRIN